MTKIKRNTTERDAIIKMLNERPSTLSFDHMAERLVVSAAWLRLLARGKIENPSIVLMHTLRDYLKTANKTKKA